MEKSEIQWTDSTVNFWTGCKKVSEGCKYCYMYRDKERYGKDPTVIMRTKDGTFKSALEWKEPRKIFTCSWSDFFIEEADKWREEAWDIIRKTPQHKWQILTKRPERIMECLPQDWGEGWDNVWFGTTVENQKTTHRIKTLADVPAKVRFISAEPLLEELDLSAETENLKKIHWCIVGGESGNETGKYRYRQCKTEWIKKLIADLKNNNVSVFVKQLGTHLPNQMGLKDKHGGDWSEWSDELKIRNFPDGSTFIEEQEKNTDMEKPKSKVKTAKDIMNLKIEATPMLLEGIIQKYGVISLAGSSDLGKSYLLLQMADAIVNKEVEFLGYKLNATHNSVVYLSTEDDEHSLCPRLLQLSSSRAEKDNYDNLKILFDHSNIAGKLEDILKESPADLVIIDTFSDIYDGDMNQANKVRSFIGRFKALARKHNTLIVLNHHCGKRNDNRPPHKDNLLGSQGFESSMRMVMELRMDFRDNSKRHLCIVKGNNIDPSQKSKSIELEFDFEKGFRNTGNRVPFEALIKSDDQQNAVKSEMEKKVLQLKADGLTYEKISEQLKSEGFKVSKSTVGNICKAEKIPSIQIPLEDEMDGQEAA